MPEQPNNVAPDKPDEALPTAESLGPTPAAFVEMLEAAAQIPPPQVGTDALAKTEEVFFDSQRREAELQSFRQDTELRKSFANRIFILIAIWLIAIFIVLLLAGFLGEGSKFSGTCFGKEFVFAPKFKLSDAVIIALISGTTVNVLGILILVVQYLFPKRTVK